MKHIFLALAISVVAVSAQASMTCKSGSYGIVVDGEKALYQYNGVEIAQADNVRQWKTAKGDLYATDFGFSLTISGGSGEFIGLWPNPGAMFSETSPLVLTCK